MRWWAFIAVAGLGCHSNAGEPADPLPGSQGVIDNTLPYPTEGIGTSKGNIIPSFCFPGFTKPTDSRAEVNICLAHFYNPDGKGVFAGAPGDPFKKGAPKPTLIVLDVSGKWCGPCKQEASKTLPGKWTSLQPKGLMILTVLADGDKPGHPADIADLGSWVTSYKCEYPSVIDPKYQMGGLFDQNSYPANFIIDAKSMKIVEFVAGAPPESFWEQVEDRLAHGG